MTRANTNLLTYLLTVLRCSSWNFQYGGRVKAGCAWIPARHNRCGSVPDTT